MENFLQIIGPVIAVAIGIMILAVFFKVMAAVGKKADEPAIIKLKSFFKDAEFVDVHLSGTNILKRVRVIGVSDVSQIGKGGFPYELNGMVVVEKENKKRIMIKAEAISMIVEADEEANKAPASDPVGQVS